MALDKALEERLDSYEFGFSDPEELVFKSRKGLSREVVAQISELKGEPGWMRDLRLRAYEIFMEKPLPTWGADLSSINFDDIYYYLKPVEQEGRSWDEVPENIKRTFERLGIPEMERKILAGVGAQYDSEIVYHSIKKELEEQGVVFLGCDQGLKEYEPLFRKWFGKVIPPEDNKFAALNTAVWSGGSFVYVPPGVKVEKPLQAYFRINAKNAGQFERTLIIVDRGAQVHYVEGCTAPIYATESLHSAVVEIIALPGARVRYSTIQNWSHNVYNLVTKRAIAFENAIVEWVDGNLGAKVTMKYPSIYLLGEGAHGEVLSIAFANEGQHQDAGAKIVFAAPNCSGQITSKSISKRTGRSSYRGLIKVQKGARNAKCRVECDALLLDSQTRTDTYPYMEIEEDDAQIEHEASVSKINEEQIFYLMSRGIPEDEAMAMVVRGFIEPVAKELPMEFAVELNRLIELEMEGSVG